MARSSYPCADCGLDIPIVARSRRDVDGLVAWHQRQGHRCRDCDTRARATANASAAAANAAAGLPPLSGSAAQIAWAESLRAAVLATFDRARQGTLGSLERAAQIGDLDLADPLLPAALDRLRAQERADWWLDRRDCTLRRLLIEQAELITAAARTPPAQRAQADAILAAATVRPAAEVTSSLTCIEIAGTTITLRQPEKRDDFRTLAKALGYRWQLAAWRRTITDRSGPLADRVAEIGHTLLDAGFPIRLLDDTLRARAIAGDWTPEHQRWITYLVSGPGAGRLYLSWGRADDCYHAARALPGARYDAPGISVPASSFESIDDFALAQGFRFSARARATLDAARDAYEQALIVTPAQPPSVATDPPPGSLPPVTDAIDPALLDD